jgi:hypothetical protein
MVHELPTALESLIFLPWTPVVGPWVSIECESPEQSEIRCWLTRPLFIQCVPVSTSVYWAGRECFVRDVIGRGFAFRDRYSFLPCRSNSSPSISLVVAVFRQYNACMW